MPERSSEACSIKAWIGLSSSSIDVAAFGFGSAFTSGSRCLSVATSKLWPPPSGVTHSVSSVTRPGFQGHAIEPGNLSKVEGLITAGSAPANIWIGGSVRAILRKQRRKSSIPEELTAGRGDAAGDDLRARGMPRPAPGGPMPRCRYHTSSPDLHNIRISSVLRIGLHRGRSEIETAARACIGLCGEAYRPLDFVQYRSGGTG